jgi:hypothetical protein
MAGFKVTPGAEDVSADKGFASRKFWITVLAMVLILLSGFIAGYFPAFGAQLTAVIGGIVGCLGLYVGANVSTKFAAAGIKKAEHVADTKKSVAATKAEATKPQMPKPKKPEPPVEAG